MKYKPDKAAVALEYGKNTVPTLTAKGRGRRPTSGCAAKRA